MPALSLERELDQLLTASSAESRYVDLALRFRRPLADFAREVPRGYEFTAAGVEFKTLAAGLQGVPVASVEPGDSCKVPAGAELRAEGAAVGTFAPTTLLEAGGRWDLLERRFTGESPQERANLDVQESQLEVVTFGAAFLASFREKTPRDHSVLFNYGPRRGGKTWILLALLLAACLDNPGLLTAAVSTSHVERMTDIDRNVRRMLPASWWSYRAWPEHAFTFLNGSQLTNISTKDKESTKRGQMDMYLLNEAAKMDQAVYENSLGGTADREGLVWIASNPPQTPRGEWVQREVQLWEAAIVRGEKDYPIHVIKTDWKGNAAISQKGRGRVARILRDLNPAASDADDLGLMLPVSPRAFWSWHPQFGMPVLRDTLLIDPGVPERMVDGALVEAVAPAEYEEITRAFIKKRWGAERDLVVGVDFQKHAGIVASFWKVFGTMERPVLLCVGDLTVDGSEHDFLDEVEDQGYGPIELLFVGDASGLTQDFEHAKGKTSYGPFIARGWKIIPPTVKVHEKSKAPKNPPVSRSLKECNRLIRERRIWCMQEARGMLDSLANCDRKQSKAGPYPFGPLAHQADGLRYVEWWIEPPAKPPRRKGGGMPVFL